MPENVPLVEPAKPLIDAGKLWEGAQDWWHRNVENRDWSNNPFTPNPGTGPLPMPLIPVF
ncbi:hypothetical protein NRF20_06560 [Streptomyces sp. R-74717]|uniref:hypothetical protein n=1 Tax=Streptomyces sp. R-74717 TaxID=2969820 RepID=UPI0039B4162F